MWILIRHARQLLFAASHSSMAKQSLNLVARSNSSGHTGKIGRPSSGRVGVQRGLAFRRILCILVHELQWHKRTPAMKSSPSAGGLPCLQAVHMATACPSASHGPYVLLQRGKEAAHAYPPFIEGMALR